VEGQPGYPVQFAVAYPDRDLNRLTTFFRIFVAIPILIVISAVDGGGNYSHAGRYAWSFSAGAGGILVFAPLLMILFRQKYPRWWFDWNLQLMRFSSRVAIFLALMDDTYPSTDEEQSVRLDFPYPDAQQGLTRWMVLVKWLLAIPHYVALFFLSIGAFICIVIAWFAILFTGRYPRGLFDFVEGVFRWWTRVIAYAFVMITDEYPPFSLSA
jgi:uncharacterized protein DUF4389